MDKIIFHPNENRCICCGEYIPEGYGLICYTCVYKPNVGRAEEADKNVDNNQK